MIFTPLSLSGWATLGLKYNFLVYLVVGSFRGTKFLTRMHTAQPNFRDKFFTFGKKNSLVSF
jgi:hypothetical protein